MKNKIAYSHEINDSIWLMVLQGLNYLAPLLVWPYLMITLGAEEFGKIGFATSINLFLMVIIDYGFNLTATKKIALADNNKTKINAIFSNTFATKLILFCISIGLLALLLELPKYAAYKATSYIMASILINSLISPIWLFQGLGKIRLASIINCISKLIIFPLFFVFVKSSNDTLIAASLQSSMYLLSGIVLFVWALCRSYAKFVNTTWQNIRNELRDSFPIFVSQAATSIYTALFVVILGYFAQTDEVGRYTAAEKIMRACCYLVWVPIAQAFFPKISKLSNENRNNAIALIKKISIFLVLAMSIIGVVIFLFAEPIATWLGKGYAGMNELTKILAFAPLFISLGGVTGQFGLLALGSEREKRQYSITYIVAATIAILLICSLTPSYGAVGASIATLVTEFIVFACMAAFYIKSLKRQ